MYLYACQQLRLNAKSEKYRKLHLPPKYISGDRQAVAHVVTEIKSQLKHVRNKIRNILLTGVVNTVSPNYVPNITELSRLLWKHCKGSKTGLTASEVDNQITPMLKIRIVHLRLVTMVNYLDVHARSASQWDHVDADLQYLRSQGTTFVKA
jgi:hypothetical protein